MFGLENFNLHEFVKFIILAIVPFFFAITIHEVSHGFVAYKLGDDTAKNMGRLTLNPISHIDPLGLAFLLLTSIFGWAKPVPVNFYNLKHKYGVAIVSASGPISNLILAVLSVIVFKTIEAVATNVAVPKAVLEPIIMMTVYSIQINVALFIFNLIPILPLDGGRILCNFLPRDQAAKFSQTERFGFVIILILCLTGVVKYIISPPIAFIYSLIM